MRSAGTHTTADDFVKRLLLLWPKDFFFFQEMIHDTLLNLPLKGSDLVEPRANGGHVGLGSGKESPKRLPCPKEQRLDCRDRRTKHVRNFRVVQPMEVTQKDRGPLFFRKVGDRFADHLGLLTREFASVRPLCFRTGIRFSFLGG